MIESNINTNENYLKKLIDIQEIHSAAHIHLHKKICSLFIHIVESANREAVFRAQNPEVEALFTRQEVIQVIDDIAPFIYPLLSEKKTAPADILVKLLPPLYIHWINCYSAIP